MQYAHAGESDSANMLLMANTQSKNEQTNIWYLDLRCNNHMSGNKNRLSKLDELIPKVIRFADGRHVTSRGKGNILMVIRDGQGPVLLIYCRYLR